MGQIRPLFGLFRFFCNNIFTENNFSRIGTCVVGAEGEHTDHGSICMVGLRWGIIILSVSEFFLYFFLMVHSRPLFHLFSVFSSKQ